MLEIDHVAAAVEDLEAAIDGFVDGGAEYVFTKESAEYDYEVAYMLAGGDMFSLISPTSPESFIASYLESNGPGFHHIGVNVEDLDASVQAFEALGAEVVMEDTVPGVREEATFHPGSWFGLQIQLIEWHDDVGPTARDHIEAMREATGG